MQYLYDSHSCQTWNWQSPGLAQALDMMGWSCPYEHTLDGTTCSRITLKWEELFLSLCLHQASLSGNSIPKGSGCWEFERKFLFFHGNIYLYFHSSLSLAANKWELLGLVS